MVIMFTSRYSKKLLFVFFTLCNSYIVFLIFTEYTNGTVPRVNYDEHDAQEHPGYNNGSSELLELQKVWTSKVHMAMPSESAVNTTDPSSHRQILAVLFNPWAYHNVDTKYLDTLADRAFKDIQSICEHNMTSQRAREEAHRSGLPLCSCSPATLLGRLKMDLAPPSLEDMERDLGLDKGGHWAPTDCVPRQRIALIIPYRDRAPHLHVFLNHYHRMLQRQNIEYRIFVTEQAHPLVFNKGSIMNTGFKIAMSYFDFDCVIFHDIDLLAEDDRHLYLCSDQPRHITARNDRSNYTKPYADLVGGAVAMTKNTFIEANGYSNSFYGWGGEDDNLAYRLKKSKHYVWRFPASISRFSMMKHQRKGKSFPYNHMVFRQLKANMRHTNEEGLNSIDYVLHGVENRTLYTWILSEMNSVVYQFRDAEGWCADGHYRYGRRATIQKCAERCQKETKCRQFSYVYAKTPVCYLYEHKCVLREHTSYVTYTFFKKSFLESEGENERPT